MLVVREGRGHYNSIIESSESNRCRDLLRTEFLGNTEPPMNLQQTEAEREQVRNLESAQDSDELLTRLQSWQSMNTMALGLDSVNSLTLSKDTVDLSCRI